MRAQRMRSTFPWLGGQSSQSPASLWSLDFREVLGRADRSLDPKRYSERYRNVRNGVQAVEHFALADVVDVIDQEGRPGMTTAEFEYVAIDDVADGMAAPRVMRGWQLPGRARHGAETRDIFVGRVWGSVSKWFIASSNADRLVVSNGFIRLRMKPGCEDYLVDIVAGLVSENYLIQARALCTGSDGLATMSETDIREIVLPKVWNEGARDEVQNVIETIVYSRATVKSIVANLQSNGALYPDPDDVRPSRWVQV